jgi:hypothetical protein
VILPRSVHESEWSFLAADETSALDQGFLAIEGKKTRGVEVESIRPAG